MSFSLCISPYIALLIETRIRCTTFFTVNAVLITLKICNIMLIGLRYCKIIAFMYFLIFSICSNLQLRMLLTFVVFFFITTSLDNYISSELQ